MPTVSDLFHIRYGHSLEMNRMRPAFHPAGVNFVGRAKVNNGVTGRVYPPPGVTPASPGELTVALGGVGGVMYTFLQPEPFVCGRDVAILTARDQSMSVPEKVWWCRCILANRYRYNYGRQANRSLATLRLPEEAPAYVSTASIPDLSGADLPVGPKQQLPPLESWRSWTLGEIFHVAKGSRLTRRSRTPGNVPFVGASMANNGVVDYVEGPPRFPAHSISVPYNGNGVAYAFLQRDPFCASDDVQVLTSLEEVAPAALLFVCQVLRRERYRFSYGRKWHLARMKTSEIKLPSTVGQVDWASMARFMEGLPFAKGAAL